MGYRRLWQSEHMNRYTGLICFFIWVLRLFTLPLSQQLLNHTVNRKTETRQVDVYNCKIHFESFIEGSAGS